MFGVILWSCDGRRRSREPPGMLSRAWSWWRVASNVPDPGEFSQAGREWFQEFAAAVPG
jgi:hypothetical protein